jgi:beta-aspartyl-peptidase (threonine type)
MERLPHVLLAGEGAAQFAHEIQAEQGDLLTPEARAIWVERLRAVLRDWGLEIGEYEISSVAHLQALIAAHGSLIAITRKALKYHEGGDTMNVVVRDADGHMVNAVTTSGVAWKYPGRVGDSPIIGAGSYVDDRYGAAVNTGWGELAIRQGTALRAVMMLRGGMPLDEAGCAAIRDLRYVKEAEKAWLRLLLVDAQGNVGGYCTSPDATFKLQTLEDAALRIIPCEHVQ